MKLSVFLLPVVLIVSTMSIGRLTSSETELSRAEQKFLIKMADARMVNLQEGQMALDQGSDQEIKEYGKRMVEDQIILMNELKKIAASKNFQLPLTISNEKARWIRTLKSENGKEFDEKFMKMVMIAHRKDLKYLRMATKFEDQAIREFASRHLQLIESHLNSAKSFNK